MESCQHHNECDIYRRLFLEAPVGLYKTRRSDGLIQQINPFGAKLLGFNDPSEVEGKFYAHDFYPKKVRKKLIEKLEKEGSVSDFEIQIRTFDGRKVWVSATATNGEDRMIGSLTDITERKAMEEEIEGFRNQLVDVMRSIEGQAKQRLSELG